jgi:hypothetical protein
MLSERLEKHSIPEPNSGCILWCAATNRPEGGYGVLRVDGVLRYAHRLAWELKHGPIPDGMQVCRQCRGERRPAAKLTEADVRLIRTTPGTHLALADQFGVAFQTIAKVRAGERWKHVQ